MKSIKLKYGLLVNGNVITFTIFEMDERFRAVVGDEKKEYVWEDVGTDLGIVTVVSEACVQPCITIYPHHAFVNLRSSDRAKDHDTLLVSCLTAAQATCWAQRIHKALAAWAKEWPGFKEQEGQCVRHRNDINGVFVI